MRQAYLDFDLNIEGAGGKYKAHVLESPAGEAQSDFSGPFSDLELEVFYLRIGRPRQGVRRLDSPEMLLAKQYGGKLFEAVFAGDVYTCFVSSLATAQAQEKGLRIRLRLNSPEMTALPWEFLYHTRRSQFLALSIETPIVRYLEAAQPPRLQMVKPPLNMVAMISSPRDYPMLDVEREWQQLKEALAELEQRGLIRLERLDQASLAALQRRLRQGDVHILHFIGHGRYDVEAGDGLLLFEDEEDRGRPLNGNYLGTLLHNHHSLRLVTLNACEGARASQEDQFSGVAQSLVSQGVPAVIAMQFEITDQAAIGFASEFYGALADGYAVDAALVEARTAIFAQGNDIEWGTPVIFTRSPDGRIFDLDLSAVKPGSQPATGQLGQVVPTEERSAANTEQRHRKSFLDGLHRRAQAAFDAGEWKQAADLFGLLAREEPDYPGVQDMLKRALTGTAPPSSHQRDLPPPGVERRGLWNRLRHLSVGGRLVLLVGIAILVLLGVWRGAPLWEKSFGLVGTGETATAMAERTGTAQSVLPSSTPQPTKTPEQPTLASTPTPSSTATRTLLASKTPMFVPTTPIPTSTTFAPRPTVPGQEGVLFAESFEWKLEEQWRTWGTPLPRIDQGFLALAGDKTPWSSGITTLGTFELQVGMVMSITMQADQRSWFVVLFDSEDIERTANKSLPGLFSLQFSQGRMSVYVQEKKSICSSVVISDKMHRYVVRFRTDGGVDLLIDGRSQCWLAPLDVSMPRPVRLTLAGAGVIDDILITRP